MKQTLWSWPCYWGTISTCVCKSLHSSCSNRWRCFRWWKRLAVFPVFNGTCARHNLQCTLLFCIGLQKNKIPSNFSGPSYQQCHPLRLGLCLPSFLPREHSFSFFYTAAAAQSNTPRLAAGMALFQPSDWFSAAQLSLSLVICIVCQKIDECNLSKSISTMFHISIEEKLFLDSYRYRFIAQSYVSGNKSPGSYQDLKVGKYKLRCTVTHDISHHVFIYWTKTKPKCRRSPSLLLPQTLRC